MSARVLTANSQNRSAVAQTLKNSAIANNAKEKQRNSRYPKVG